jgi:hypothetical protein
MARVASGGWIAARIRMRPRQAGHSPHQLGPGVVPGARAAVPRIAGPIAGARLGTGQSFRLAPLRRKILNQMSPVEAMELLIDKMSKSAANEQFLMMMQGG